MTICDNCAQLYEGDSHMCLPCSREECTALRSRIDALAAENRAIRQALIEVAGDEMGGCQFCGDAYFGDQHGGHCPVGRGISLPHTAREVERVKALEAVAEAARGVSQLITCESGQALEWELRVNGVAEALRSSLAALDAIGERGEWK